MERVLGRLSPQIYGVLRIVAGILFAMHGAQKLFGVFGGRRVSLMTQFGAFGVIELVCGLMIAFGVLTGLAAFIASIEMAATYVIVYAPQALIPRQNGGELVVLYCFLFLYIASRGTVALGIKR